MQLGLGPSITHHDPPPLDMLIVEHFIIVDVISREISSALVTLYAGLTGVPSVSGNQKFSLQTERTVRPTT